MTMICPVCLDGDLQIKEHEARIAHNGPEPPHVEIGCDKCGRMLIQRTGVVDPKVVTWWRAMSLKEQLAWIRDNADAPPLEQ